MFNFFRRNKKARKNITNADMAKSYAADIHKTEIEKVEVPKVEPERINTFEMRYMDTKTGEIFTFDSRDFDAFDKVMSNKDYKLIFG